MTSARPACAQETQVATQTLNLIVNVPAHTPAGSQFYFTGGPETGCDWRPDCHALQAVDAAGLSYGEQLQFPASFKMVEFKITRGSWETEAADSEGQPLVNQVAYLNGTSSIAVDSVVTWKDLGGLGVTGRVIDLGMIAAPQIKASRHVTVWIPSSYSQNTTKRYPVLYMHDGQNLFDPSTSSYGVDWDVDRTMTRIAETSGLEAIVVGIESASDSEEREEEYDVACKGKLYADFLIKNLKPLIDSHFRTLPGRETTFTAGASMGATISVDLVWLHPEVFSKALAFSLPVSVHNNSVIEMVNSTAKPSLPISLYVDHGGWGEDRDYKQGVVDFIETLRAHGLTSPQVWYAQFPYHDHTEADWARRLEQPLRWLLK